MELKKINEIAKKLNIDESFVEPYGFYKAKIDYSKAKGDKKGHLILVTAITPTKAGEGKTTTAIALGDGLNKLGKSVCLALREPSLGPVFGMKGGATGGGKVTVEPQEEINLHFTGDMHALTSANNLISAVIDNHIFQGNELNIDPKNIVFKRAMDMNDRALRQITVAQGKKNGIEREDGFVITVASELMAIMCISKGENDFKQRVGDIIVAYTYDNKPITVRDLKIVNAVMKLMREALKPNLVQTSYGTPALIHGGPFANIAHGCNSIIATKLALSLSDYVVTEAGFGSDLGAEKFLDIKCQEANLKPELCVVVATIRALKLHGGADENNLECEDLESLKKGLPNLERHLNNMKKFGLPTICNINIFSSDTKNELELLENWLNEKGFKFALNDAYSKGAEGAIDIAKLAVETIDENNSSFHPLYTKDMKLADKINLICKEIYGAKNVIYSEKALAQLSEYEKKYSDFYVCMAKTPLSFSDDSKLKGAPDNFDIHIKRINLSHGAKFIVPLTGAIMTMPGLPKIPAAVKMEEE